MLEEQLNNEYMRHEYEPLRLSLNNYGLEMALEILRMHPVKTYEERVKLEGYEVIGNPEVIREINSYAKKINQAAKNGELTKEKLEKIIGKVERIFNGNHQRTCKF